MRVVRWLGRWAGTGLWVAVLAPSLALLPAAVLDRGPGGGVRFTAFPLGLSALDPFLWECARNSAAVALLVAGMSLWLGSALASSVVRRRYWGRPLLGWLWFAPLAFTPAFAAIGLRGLMAPGGGLDRLAPGLGLVPLAGWVAWAWAGLTTGVPLVALATASALSRVEPAWEDAARLAGASPRRIWRQLVWPVARPASARAAGMAFALTLVDPGAPLVLGLRRTLAFQVVEACLGPAPAPRAAVLALATAAIALVGRVLIRWWGGAATPGLDSSDPVAPAARPLDARWPRASAYLLTFGTGAFLAWLPVLALVATASAGGGGRIDPAGSAWRWLSAGGEARRLLLNSSALGLAAVAVDVSLASTLAAWAGRRHAWVLSLAAWPEFVTPLAIGAGATVLPALIESGADWARAVEARGALVRTLVLMAGALDPSRTPGLVLVLAVSASRLPFLSRSVEHGWGRSRPAPVDAAHTLGATPRQARRVATGLRLGASPAVLFLTFAMAATNLAPALLLAPTAESRPLAPAALILADTPGDGLAHAAALACVAVALNLVALTVAAASRAVRLGDWFRG